MSNRTVDDRSRSAAAAARAWASDEAEIGTDAALASVRDGTAAISIATRSNRRAPLLLGAAAAVIVGAVVGAAVLVDRAPDDDLLVPVDTQAPESTIVDTSVVAPLPPPSTAADAPDEPVAADPAPPPAPQTFVIDLDDVGVQDTFPITDAVLGVGSDIEQLGRDERPGPPAPTIVDRSRIVVADPVNGRVHVVDPSTLAVSREEFQGEEGFSSPIVAIETLEIFADADLQPENIVVGQPVAGPNGDEIFLPAFPNLPATDFSMSVHRFVRGADSSWEVADDVVPAVPATVDDEFLIEGRSLVHVASGSVVFDLGPDAPFVPIVRALPDGWVVTDEAGNETIWSVPFVGDATGLADGSVVISGSRTDGGDAADPAALLLRLWPDGTSAASRLSPNGGVGSQRVTADGVATISTTDDGDWLLEHWPLPGRAVEPPTQPDEDLGDCDALFTSDRFLREPANGYLFPWTISGGPAGANGAYVSVYDALGRVVVGGGCSSTSLPVERLEVQGADYTTYGDSIIVALAEPLSLGGVDDAPAWLGDPIAEGVIDSLASEVKVYRVPDDRELPTADNDNTFLLVQIRGARLINISSGGIGILGPPIDVTAPLDPFDLQSTATAFAQGYLDALAEGRWEDAVAYIENDGRNWEDRPAFADLFALVGEDVGTAGALELWCTQERECTRGVANGVLEQVNDSQVNVAITFEVPGGAMFERTINPLWTVGWFEGGLYIDGLPQVAR